MSDTKAIIAVVAVALALIIGLGWYAVVATNDARVRCEASGRHYVVDHYVTTYFSQKVGTSIITTPVQAPVYKCVE